MICIAGADGFFGSYLKKALLSCYPDETLLCLNHGDTPLSEKNIINVKFEMSDEKSIENAAEILMKEKDVRIIFLAAAHNPDLIKKDPERALYINTVCYESFLEKTKNADIKKLIYASSDTVYGESTDDKAFKEDDELHPINIYGEHKKAAEEITSGYSYSIARYSYMCEKSISHRKKHFFDTVYDSLKRGEKVYMLTDWIRPALTYSAAAAVTLNYLFSSHDTKILNICADEAISKYDIGLKIAEYANADKSLVIPCTSEELGIFTEKRAEKILMDNSLSKKLGLSGSTELCF